MPKNKNPAGRERIGFIGLGAMGLPLAHTLLKAGFAVTGNDTDSARMAAHRDHGGAVCLNAAEATRSCDIVITCLPQWTP